MKIRSLSHIIPVYFFHLHCLLSVLHPDLPDFFPVLCSPSHFFGLLLLRAHNEDSLEITHGFLESLCLQSQSQACRTFVFSKGPLVNDCVREWKFRAPLRTRWGCWNLAWNHPCLLLSILYPAPSLASYRWVRDGASFKNHYSTLRAQGLSMILVHMYASLPAEEGHSF